MLKEIILFLGIILGTVYTTYYTSEVVASLYYLVLLAAYFRSTNEAMWLAVFLVVSDGFIGFFGPYQTTLGIIPGLPPIEIGQLYILLTIVKAIQKGASYVLYYRGLLGALFFYLIFLIVQGFTMGLSVEMNIIFRIIKETVPLLLFFSLPRLMDSEEAYAKFFAYLFPIAISALLAQVFTITVGNTPSEFLGGTKADPLAFSVKEGRTYRGFFSSGTILITYLGALYFLARKEKYFLPIILYAVLAGNFLTAFLSATRGWVLSLGFIGFLYLVFVLRLDIKRLFILGTTAIVLFIGLLSFPIVGKQVDNALDRMFTLSSLASGDLTAGGTLARISERSPRVVKKWLESPLTGWGFSDTFMRYSDLHVANQNILMHAGIVGFLLMLLFFFWFNWKLFLCSASLPRSHPLKELPLVFIVFFLGWFMLHSSSGQYFSYYQAPAEGILLGVFFSFGGLFYHLITNNKLGNKTS